MFEKRVSLRFRPSGSQFTPLPIICELRSGTLVGDLDCGALERWLQTTEVGLPTTEKRSCRKEWDALVCEQNLRSMQKLR